MGEATIFQRVARRFLRGRKPPRSRLYGSYAEALADCGEGYEEGALVAVVYEKTRRFRDRLMSGQPLLAGDVSLGLLAGLGVSIDGRELGVIDFGGACGAHYFLARTFFGGRVSFRWHVVETAKMAEAARPLEDGQLRFFHDVAAAKRELDRVDLVFVSGALQYVPRPVETLAVLAGCGARNIMFVRTALSAVSRELVTVQTSTLGSNGPGPLPPGFADRVVRYPVTCIEKSRFEEILAEQYTVVMLVGEGGNNYSAGEYAVDTYTCYGRHKAAGAGDRNR